RGHGRTPPSVAGRGGRGLVAPMVRDGPMDAAAFVAYVEQVLANEVRGGALVILDNLSSHKTAGVRAALGRCRIAYLYLPPYSPDLNPIEQAFSKLKRLVRGAGERTVEGVWSALGRLIDPFTPAECRNYLRHCGYHATKT